MSNNRLIMIVVDALRFDTACSHMGFMQHLVEQGKVARYEVKSEVPSLSRPLYETLLTGTPPLVHGIVGNGVVRLSTQESLFHLAKRSGKTTAAAAYHWVSELYNHAPFRPGMDRIQLDKDAPIENGLFYFEDHYPDNHLFAEAKWLVSEKKPDFLYIHPMNVDDDGHKFTGDSIQYRNRVLATDALLALSLPEWMELGYNIIVTADHGMTSDGNHGGNTTNDRHVPLFIVSNKVKPVVQDQIISQLQVAPLACHLLGIDQSEAMVPLIIPGVFNKIKGDIKNMNRKKRVLFILVPFALLMTFFFLVPLIYMLMSSFSNSEGFTLEHYQEVLTSSYILQGFKNSFALSVVSAFVALVASLLGVYSMTYLPEPVRERLLILSNLTSNFAGVPLAFAFIVLLGNSGLFTLALDSFGWDLSFSLYSWSGLLLIYIYFQLPLSIMLLYPIYYGIQQQWKDAAALLGASKFTFWKKIGLPILFPGIAGTFTILFANAIGAYASAYALTGSNFNLAAIRIGALIKGDIFAQPELASAIAVLLGVIMIIGMLLSEWLTRKTRKDLSER